VRSLTRNTKGGRGGVMELWDGTRKSEKLLVTQICIQPTNKLVSSLSVAHLVLGQITCDFGLTRLTMA
jgi:hypothetical protein